MIPETRRDEKAGVDGLIGCGDDESYVGEGRGELVVWLPSPALHRVSV